MNNRMIEKIMIELKGEFNLTDYEAIDLAIKINNEQDIPIGLNNIKVELEHMNNHLYNIFKKM